MKRKKKFDCVEMKNAIQARLVARYRGVEASRLAEEIEERLARSNQPIAKFWRRISGEKRQKVTESHLAHR